eukprot:1926626-Rhodomonas_salina.2
MPQTVLVLPTRSSILARAAPYLYLYCMYLRVVPYPHKQLQYGPSRSLIPAPVLRPGMVLPEGEDRIGDVDGILEGRGVGHQVSAYGCPTRCP